MLEDILNHKTLSLPTPGTSERYRQAEGFPHIVLDDFLDETIAHDALAEFPPVEDERWINYLHYNEKKFGLTKREVLSPRLNKLIDELHSQRFLDFLTDLTGITGLIADPSLEGGGLHQTPQGGFLNIHADFTVHPHHRDWRRRVNVLVYLNQDWQDEYGGQLELWTRDMTRMFSKVSPLFNRCVIFNTDADSFHGHPEPLHCPAGVTRKSIALYYYTVEAAPLKLATYYRKRPDESFLKGIAIWADQQLLVVYNWIKGKLGLTDDLASRFLKALSRWKK